MAGLPLNMFPGFTSYGLVSEAVREIATTFNAEGLNALQEIPEKSVAWADVGTRVTKMSLGQGKIPIRLTSLLGFEPFEGERKFHELTLAANIVKVNPWQLNLEWPVQISQSGIAELVNFYGVQGIAGDVVSHARAHKADTVASVIIAGMTNAALGMTAKSFTLEQPGGLTTQPLFSDGSTSGSSKHYSNPVDARSRTFSNLTLNAGKITADGVMGTMLTNMTQVPHPSKLNMNMGLEVTDIIGGTNMLIPFYMLALQTLRLEVASSVGAATTNIYTPEMLAKASQQVGVAGLTPWRFWIAPQLDAHPYLVAHPTYQMWLAVSRNRNGSAWCELGAPSTDYTPRITLLGDGSEECIKSRKVRLLSDLDSGGAAGLPHFVHMYLETTP